MRGLPHPPLARHKDRRSPSPETPVDRYFRPRLASEEIKPSRAQAAFRLGHLGVAMWSWAELLRDDLARRIEGYIWHESADRALGDAADLLLDARRILAGSISAEVSEEIRSIVARFKDLEKSSLAAFHDGTFDPYEGLDRDRPWQAISQDLEEVCNRSIGLAHPLRPVFDLGVAFGQFFLRVEAYLVDLARGRNDGEIDLMPEIRDIAIRAAEIPASIIHKSAILDSLATTGRRYDEIGHPEALMDYFESNWDMWSFPGPKKIQGGSIEGDTELDRITEAMTQAAENHREGLESPFSLGRMRLMQIVRVEEDLSAIPDDLWHESLGATASAQEQEYLAKPIWAKRESKLYFKGECIRSVKSNGKNMLTILDSFKEEDWPTTILDPLMGPQRTQARRLDDAVRDLNSKLVAGTIRFRVVARETISWEPVKSPTNTQSTPS